MGLHEDCLDLGPLERKVRIAGQQFTLREMVGPDLDRYAQLVTQSAMAVADAVRAIIRPRDAQDVLARAAAALTAEGSDQDRLAALLAAVTPGDLTRDGLEAAVAQSVQLTTDRHNEILRWILGVDDEWIRANLTHSMRQALLSLQDELNGTAEIVKNVEPLLLSVA